LASDEEETLKALLVDDSFNFFPSEEKIFESVFLLDRFGLLEVLEHACFWDNFKFFEFILNERFIYSNLRFFRFFYFNRSFV
jgi:hypothetical protein